VTAAHGSFAPVDVDPVGDRVVELLSLASRPAWHKKAACRSHPVSWWFPDQEHRADGRLARAICETCPVREECAGYGIVHEPDDGIWAGMTVQQRRQVRRERGLSAVQPQGAPRPGSSWRFGDTRSSEPTTRRPPDGWRWGGGSYDDDGRARHGRGA
jgi:WhiB family redox-sensing transcriptional regulator